MMQNEVGFRMSTSWKIYFNFW